MTERLYWKHPELNTFTARMIHTSPCVEKEGTCDRSETMIKVWLDQTLFYPEGGGQPCDVGFLKVSGLGVSFPVTRVNEEDNDIVHYVYCPSDELDSLLVLNGNEVCAKIDWQRRFDHMQQHTGQHIVSQVFLRVLGASTTSFHMGQEYTSIDLDVGEISQDQVREVEQVANEVVFGNAPVKAAEYAPCDLPPMVRRRLPKETETIRVIKIGDFDACACGGTHVISTGQVGLIKICEVGRAHGGVRVVFRCGGRALADYRQKNEAAWACARLLSVPVDNIDNGVQSLLVKLEEREQEVKRQQRLIVKLETDVLSQEATEADGVFVKGLQEEQQRSFVRWLKKWLLVADSQ